MTAPLAAHAAPAVALPQVKPPTVADVADTATVPVAVGVAVLVIVRVMVTGDPDKKVVLPAVMANPRSMEHPDVTVQDWDAAGAAVQDVLATTVPSERVQEIVRVCVPVPHVVEQALQAPVTQL